jgi:hypothetical protein
VWLIAKGLMFTWEELVEIGKGVVTNGNKFGVEFDSKNFKA